MTQHESLPLFTFATIPATSRPYATKANMAPGGSLELRLTVRYEGLKATQYFAKFTSESDKVFRDDLLALKLPHPRMEHTNLLSHGSVECFWESVQKDGALHQQLVNKALPSDKENQVILAENLKDLSIAKLTVKQLDYRNPNNSAAMRRQNPPSQYSPSSITKRPFPFGRSPNPVANPGLPPRPAPPKSHPEDVFRTSTNPYSLILDNAFPDRPSTPNPYYAKPPYGAPDITAPISPMKRPSSDWPGTARTTAGQSGPSSLKRPHAAISNVQQGQGSSSSKRLSSEMDWEDWQQLVSDKQKVLDWRSSNSVMDLNMGRPIKVAKTHAGSFELPKKPVVDVPPPNRAISPLPPRTAKLPKQPVVEQPPSQQASSVKTQASGPDPPLAAPSASVQKAPMSSTPSWPRADRVDDPRVTSQRRLSSGAVPSACAVAPTPTQKSVPLAPSTPAPSPIPALASTSRARTIVVPMRGGPRPAPRRPLAQVTREQTREIASASATTDVVVQSTPSTFKATLAPMSGPQPPIASTTIGGNAEAAPVKVPPVDLGHKRPHIEQADARALALKMATKAHEPPAPAPTTTTTPSSGSAPSRPVMPAQHPVASARVATTS
ncbi:unnamed protein product [Cyclocybe aegerita]|uniref:Uncharacterized protein n=1 Tax=Cyclocybe aegerita TaxID=1973307 RepID=A0A8S0X0P5_CYCAE|nr:unnamed protein product [Cyclocybe aegerita]